MNAPNSFRLQPDERGHFGEFGGRFVAETLMPLVLELDIAYRAATVEQMVEAGAGPFDVVLTMEVIEHVADPEAFVRACSKLIKPGGLMIVATLNRTLKGLLLGSETQNVLVHSTIPVLVHR